MQPEPPTSDSVTENRSHAAPDGAVVRPRAIILGFLLAAVICAATPFNNTYRQATPLGGGHFPLAPFFILVWLTLLVAGGRRIFTGKKILSGTELLVCWILMVLVSGIPYTGLMRTLLINLTAPYHFASMGNRWPDTLQPLLPHSWYPQSRKAITALYDGLPGGRQMSWWQVIRRIPWQAWATPVMVWGSFILACYFVMICMINLLSRQALSHERMNFPLLRVPILMEEALDQSRLGRFFANRFMLAGMAIPVFLHLINGFHFYNPSVPQIPTLILAGPYFPKHGLFSGFAKLKIYFYPAFIGFAFLASKQISFSFWLFFILGALLYGILGLLGYNIPASALGITFGPTLARPEETQMIGAYGIFFVFLVWLARRHLVDVIRQAMGRRPSAATEGDWLSTRISFWGFFIGSSVLVLWLHFFGLPLWASVVVLCAFFMVMLVASRVICQGGVAYFTLTAAPMDGLLTFFGPQFFTQVGILITAVVQKVLFVDLRESLMPSLLHAQRITHGVRARRGLITGGIFATLISGVAVSFVAMLALGYKFGLRELQLDWATRTSVAVYENINTLVTTPVKPGHWVLIFTLIGAAVMLVLVACYHRFYWWPIHPIGYLTAYSSAMRILWFSFFVGWLANALCMRYGGVVLFKRLRYFFIGLIIGDFLMGGGWAIYGLFSDASYQVLPG